MTFQKHFHQGAVCVHLEQAGVQQQFNGIAFDASQNKQRQSWICSPYVPAVRHHLIVTDAGFQCKPDPLELPRRCVGNKLQDGIACPQILGQAGGRVSAAAQPWVRLPAREACAERLSSRNVSCMQKKHTQTTASTAAAAATAPAAATAAATGWLAAWVAG